MHKRPKGVLSVGWACFTSAASGRTEHVPTSDDYPDSVVRRFRFEAGGGLGWKISALTTPRERPAPWKIVVVTGAPSWAEYWAPVLAQLPPDREMVVVDRPGYAGSEPVEYVGDIQVQARALAPATLWLSLLPVVIMVYFSTNVAVRALGYDVRPFPGRRAERLIARFGRALIGLGRWLRPRPPVCRPVGTGPGPRRRCSHG